MTTDDLPDFDGVGTAATELTEEHIIGLKRHLDKIAATYPQPYICPLCHEPMTEGSVTHFKTRHARPLTP